ncbi:MAG: class I SAM-dependent methyltransferase [Nitrososphaerales archaeon]
MNRAPDVAERFDRISKVYDETREPLAEEALDKAALVLLNDGCSRILEVGIGTGRIAKPLQQRNFEIVGVDFSRGMLTKAQRKGIKNLVMGDANHLPFGDKTVDAAVLAHVLHLLEDPAETFGKLSRVARNEIVAFVRKRDGASSPFLPGDERSVLRQTFRKVAEEMGYTLPSGPNEWRARLRREAEFLSSFPPNELITIQDMAVVTTLGERLSFFEKRAYGFLDGIPDDIFHKVTERVRSSIDESKEIRYRRVEQMAIWRLPH